MRKRTLYLCVKVEVVKQRFIENDLSFIKRDITLCRKRRNGYIAHFPNAVFIGKGRLFSDSDITIN